MLGSAFRASTASRWKALLIACRLLCTVPIACSIANLSDWCAMKLQMTTTRRSRRRLTLPLRPLDECLTFCTKLNQCIQSRSITTFNHKLWTDSPSPCCSLSHIRIDECRATCGGLLRWSRCSAGSRLSSFVGDRHAIWSVNTSKSANFGFYFDTNEQTQSQWDVAAYQERALLIRDRRIAWRQRACVPAASDARETSLERSWSCSWNLLWIPIWQIKQWADLSTFLLIHVNIVVLLGLELLIAVRTE